MPIHRSLLPSILAFTTLSPHGADGEPDYERLLTPEVDGAFGSVWDSELRQGAGGGICGLALVDTETQQVIAVTSR